MCHRRWMLCTEDDQTLGLMMQILCGFLLNITVQYPCSDWFAIQTPNSSSKILFFYLSLNRYKIPFKPFQCSGINLEKFYYNCYIIIRTKTQPKASGMFILADGPLVRRWRQDRLLYNGHCQAVARKPQCNCVFHVVVDNYIAIEELWLLYEYGPPKVRLHFAHYSRPNIF
jgi:hypothetical protein